MDAIATDMRWCVTTGKEHTTVHRTRKKRSPWQSAAAAASIGLINSFGNLGGAVGPTVIGIVRDVTGSFSTGLRFLALSGVISALIIMTLGIGRKVKTQIEFVELTEPA